MPGTSSHRRTAAAKPIRSRLAKASMQASARSPMPRRGVLRVGEHAQVGQRVADLLALVEAHAADDAIGQADPDEHLLEDTRLRVGPVEDGDV